MIYHNIQNSSFQIVNVPINKKTEYQGIYLKIMNTQLWNADKFVKFYGKESVSFFQDYPIEKTKVVVCEVEINNVGKSDVSVDVIWNSHLRVNHGLATYFEPFLTSQLNKIFEEKDHTGVIDSNKKEIVSLFFPLYDDSMPQDIWNNLIAQQFVLCIPDMINKNQMYEFSLQVGEP